jgi:hypothetical protein
MSTILPTYQTDSVHPGVLKYLAPFLSLQLIDVPVGVDEGLVQVASTGTRGLTTKLPESCFMGRVISQPVVHTRIEPCRD